MKRRVISPILGVGCLILIGCASVTVKKVPTPTQYNEWNDAQQAKADRMEGIRFYLPRPFVNVFESFPITSDIFLVEGQVSPDGKYVNITDVHKDSEFRRYFASGQELSQNYSRVPSVVPVQAVELPSAETLKSLRELANVEGFEFLQQSGDEGEANSPDEQSNDVAQGAADDAIAAADRAKESAEAARDASNDASAASANTTPATEPTGLNRRAVTNDNGAFAYQPLRGNFDIVYLPDFEEQYVVSSVAGLGNAEFQINLGQSWSLQGFNSLTDNSEINKRIFDLVDTGIAAGKAALGIPAPDALKGIGDTFVQQSGSPAETLKPGAEVTLKVVVVYYAAKGLYPVIKPRELAEIKSDAVVIYPSDEAPRIMHASDLTSPRVKELVANHDRSNGRYSVPVYPYQYISFNTFRYMAVEVLTNNGLPFGTLYDKTGTMGDPGDRQHLPQKPITVISEPTTAEDFVSALELRVFSDLNFKPSVIEKSETEWVIRVENQGTDLVDDYDAEERMAIAEQVMAEAETLRIKERIKSIELPPGADQLEAIMERINESQEQSDSANHWKIMEFNTEANGIHRLVYQAVGTPVAPEADFKQSVQKEFDTLINSESERVTGGQRELEFHK